MNYNFSEFGPSLPNFPLVSDGFFNMDFFRMALARERSDSHKRFNEIIKEIFSDKEVDECEDADAAVE